MRLLGFSLGSHPCNPCLGHEPKARVATLLILHKFFCYLNNLLGDHISWQHAFQSHNQSIAMQAYIEHCEDYYMSK
jgi:hypothetical protein